MARREGHDGRAGADGAEARPTGHDVARAAGVSQATVSLVLGGKWQGRVAPRTAENVREAARTLGYRPNLAARSLRMGRSRTALLVVPALTNDFFAGVHAGAVEVASAHDFGLVLYPSPDGIAPARDPFASASAAVDGVIASSMAVESLTALRAGGLPLVMLDSDASDADATVTFDVADGMRQVAGHLLGLGHRRFAHLAADVDSWTFAARARALTRALREDGASLVRTERAELSVTGGLEAAARLLSGARAAQPPTALVCDDDLIAAGALKTLRRLGLRVPEDISVTGFDDVAVARAVEPELTTLRLPAARMGAAGMRALLRVLDGGETPHTAKEGDRETVLPATLLPRASTGPAPAG